jgi:intergrase/recombinase
VGQIIKFAVLVGLRASEVVESVRLLNMLSNSIRYYNPERQALEHFRFPDIFLRQTKKAYISFVTPEMLEIVKFDTSILASIPSYNQIRLACWTRHIKMDMHLCRKIFASWLRKEGIQPEVIDLLQGRVSQSILTRHYLVPQITLKDDVLNALEKLQRQLD